MTIDYSLIWLIFEWIIFILMAVPVPFFFYKQYRKDKAEGNKGAAAFNLGYMLFFIFTSLNQLVYIIDAVDVYSSSIGWDIVLAKSVKNILVYEYNLKSQIILMFCLFFCSFLPIIYPVEKYIQKNDTFIVSILIFISAIATGISWFIFCYLRIPQPDILFFYIIVGIMVLISLFSFLISVIAFIYFYIKLAAKSTGAVRKKALIVTFGILFMYISLIGGNLTRPNVLGTPLELIGPICLLLGIVILIYGFKIKGF
ncbi:MAG: hypothetical protein ACTSQJ_11050 [Promethearchaeota archaeon]